jgi:hypothetical protein
MTLATKPQDLPVGPKRELLPLLKDSSGFWTIMAGLDLHALRLYACFGVWAFSRYVFVEYGAFDPDQTKPCIDALSGFQADGMILP